MAINKKDIIGMINSYRRSRGKKALPAGANLADYDAQDKYLTDLVSKSPTEEIQIMTPEDAQQISKAINMLGSFDNIGTVEDMREKIERGTEVAKVFFQQENKVEPPIANIDQTFREQSAFGSVPEEVGYRRGIRTLGMLKKTRDDWMQKKDYVYFPLKEDKKYWEKHPDLNFERGQYIKDTANTYWMELSKELPDDTRIRVQSLLNQTQDANHLFELDKNRYTSIFSDIIAKYSDQAKGQGALADNTLINIADFTDLEKEAFQKIESFSTLPTQTEVMPKYSNAMAELQSIFQAFGYKTTAERNEEKAKAEESTRLKEARMSAQDKVDYENLSKDQKRALESAGKQNGMSGQEYYNRIQESVAGEEQQRQAEALAGEQKGIGGEKSLEQMQDARIAGGINGQVTESPVVNPVEQTELRGKGSDAEIVRTADQVTGKASGYVPEEAAAGVITAEPPISVTPLTVTAAESATVTGGISPIPGVDNSVISGQSGGSSKPLQPGQVTFGPTKPKVKSDGTFMTREEISKLEPGLRTGPQEFPPGIFNKSTKVVEEVPFRSLIESRSKEANIIQSFIEERELIKKQLEAAENVKNADLIEQLKNKLELIENIVKPKDVIEDFDVENATRSVELIHKEIERRREKIKIDFEQKRTTKERLEKELKLLDERENQLKKIEQQVTAKAEIKPEKVAVSITETAATNAGAEEAAAVVETAAAEIAQPALVPSAEDNVIESFIEKRTSLQRELDAATDPVVQKQLRTQLNLLDEIENETIKQPLGVGIELETLKKPAAVGVSIDQKLFQQNAENIKQLTAEHERLSQHKLMLDAKSPGAAEEIARIELKQQQLLSDIEDLQSINNLAEEMVMPPLAAAIPEEVAAAVPAVPAVSAASPVQATLRAGVHKARILSRAERIAQGHWSEHVAISGRNLDKWRMVLKGKMNVLDYILTRESLLGKSYPEELLIWLGKQTKLLATNIKDGMVGFVVRQLNRVEFVQKAKVWFKGIESTYLKWERKSKVAGKILRRFRIIPKLLKRRKKSLVSLIASAVVKGAIQMVVGGAQLAVKASLKLGTSVNNALRLPKQLINSPTGVYKKLTEFAENKNVGALVGDEVTKFVRIGWTKMSVMAGDALSIFKAVGRPFASIYEALPVSLLAGLAVGLVAGPTVGITVGAVALTTNTIDKFLSRSPNDILALGSKYSVYDPAMHLGETEATWGFLGRTFHSIAKAFRFPYQKLADNFSAGFLKGKILETGRPSFLTDQLAKDNPALYQELAQKEINAYQEVFRRGGIYSAGHIALKAFNAALLLGALGFAFGGIPGMLIGAGVGAVAQTVISKVENKIFENLAKTPGEFRAFPFTEAIGTIGNISFLGQELSLIQTKYHWDFAAYFANEFNDPWSFIGRSANWILGGWSLLKYPKLIIKILQSTVFDKLFATGTSAAERISGLGPNLIGTAIGFGLLILMGVPMTPTVIGLGLLGGTVAALGSAVIIPLLGVSGPVGWIIGIVTAAAATFGGGKLGEWIDKTFNNALNKVMAGFGMVLNGLQALFELFMIMKFGVNILNVLQLILAISSLMATMRYLETLSGTNTCTTEEECPANSGNGFISQGQVDYLAYYDLKVISNDTVSQKQNIQKILALLNQDPTFLESNYGTRKKYIYVGDTNDVYINDDSVIIAISQKQLFSGTSISALINQSTASLQ